MSSERSTIPAPESSTSAPSRSTAGPVLAVRRAQAGGRADHVPSAVHVPIEGVLDDLGSFRDTPDLAVALTGADLSGPAGLITYCAIGGRAATAWFVLTQLLGRSDVRVYDGSWAEWGLDSANPVERT